MTDFAELSLSDSSLTVSLCASLSSRGQMGAARDRNKCGAEMLRAVLAELTCGLVHRIGTGQAAVRLLSDAFFEYRVGAKEPAEIAQIEL